jgi:hypothetical protein
LAGGLAFPMIEVRLLHLHGLLRRFAPRNDEDVRRQPQRRRLALESIVFPPSLAPSGHSFLEGERKACGCAHLFIALAPILTPNPLHKWRREQIAPSPLGRDGERSKGERVGVRALLLCPKACVTASACRRRLNQS